ncbi:antigen 5 like allergen Cul n 1-like isoform X2 [Contarinia nasturtii]|uniref:antigen 5 like allergen Cul n 1-like isoform X2 n=1 Tax=Contarinia nasturtii TaxID=265458 RepID=UPI0012D4A6D2|nr:antigen 5 like allergen Cul n 1-like isoform X2 [Contarinia nasturtii]
MMGKACPPNAVIIDFTDELKEFVLNTHNSYRNQIALGGIKGYQKASRMATLVWDDDLAQFAEYNVRTCTFAHDLCRNTGKYRYAGQNLALSQNSKEFDKPKKIIESMTKGWFDEYNDANMDVINNFRTIGRMIGHFTQLVRDEAYAVGCAIVQFKKHGWYTTIYACDYSLTNMLKNPIYQGTSNTASQCLTGTNPRFEGLCSIKEIYDNELFYKNNFYYFTNME